MLLDSSFFPSSNNSLNSFSTAGAHAYKLLLQSLCLTLILTNKSRILSHNLLIPSHNLFPPLHLSQFLIYKGLQCLLLFKILSVQTSLIKNSSLTFITCSPQVPLYLTLYSNNIPQIFTLVPNSQKTSTPFL